jgi:hypothetical protein
MRAVLQRTAQAVGPPDTVGGVAEPRVTKEFCEEPAEPGVVDFDYSHWVYWFDFGDRKYRARIYLDEPGEASVMHLTHPKPPQYDDDLRVVAAHLREDAGIRSVSTLDSAGGFVPTIVFE